MSKSYKAIGLMSGTSLDGLDVALIKSDGVEVFDFGFFKFYEFDNFEVDALIKSLPDNYWGDEVGFIKSAALHELKKLGVRELLVWLMLNFSQATKIQVAYIEAVFTAFCGMAVKNFLQSYKLSSQDIDLIGFHGQTIFHNIDEKYPQNSVTWQIGDGNLLAYITKIDVVNDFRSHDVSLGGQGAPLIPVFHKALCISNLEPVAIVNIGGVANLTYINEGEVYAVDTGAGNALIDDYCRKFYGANYDDGGKIALQGRVHNAMLQKFLADKFFKNHQPKSLDRNYFHERINEVISCYELIDDSIADYDMESSAIRRCDVIATLAEFTVESVILSLKFFSNNYCKIYICGGGAKNRFIMNSFANKGYDVGDISALNKQLDADAIEAQGFAFMAIRSFLGYGISCSSTTGVRGYQAEYPVEDKIAIGTARASEAKILPKKSWVVGGVFCPA